MKQDHHHSIRLSAQLAALRDISRAMQAAQDLPSTLSMITATTAEVMGVASCSVYLLDAAGEYLVLKATTGLASEAVGKARLRLGEGITGWAAQHGVPAGVHDAARDPRFKYLPETNEKLFQSLLAVPLVSRDRVIGAINVQTAELRQYSEDETELLSLIGDLVAGTLEKAVLYENMSGRVAELSALMEVSRAVIAPLYLDEVLGVVMRMTAQVMNAGFCSLMLIDEESGRLLIRATQRPVSTDWEGPSFRVGEGLIGRVAQSGISTMTLNLYSDSDDAHARFAAQEGLVSLLSVPLKVRDRVIGVLNCYTKEPHVFSPEEVNLFTSLANQTALAIENARLVTHAAVIREMHHRVKNNLQTIAMLLRLQMTEEPSEAQRALGEAINRILSMSVVHDILSVGGLRRVDVKPMIVKVAETTVQNMVAPDKQISISVIGDGAELSAQQATALALAANELVQNAVEHAFVGREVGVIKIQLAHEPGCMSISVQDDGVGFPQDEASSSDRLGLRIVRMLVEEDLHGELELTSLPGLRAVLRIPLES